MDKKTVYLTDEQAWEVLERVKKYHDCEYGVTWDFIRECANDLFPHKSQNASDI